MATQITFTDDVLSISTASNVDGSIRWHVYEKPHGNGTSLFVQREVNEVLQPEVRLLAEGARPEVFFDEKNAEWLLIYNLQENGFLVRYDENEVPTPLIPQVGDTAADHFSTRPGSAPTAGKPLEKRRQEQVVNRNFQDGDNAPPSPDTVAVAAGPTPGTNFRIRWLPHTGQEDVRIDGFHVYVRRLSDGGMQKVTTTPVPYQGSLLQVHEFVAPAVAGRWYVTQVNRKGLAGVTGATEEGRKREPSDFVPGQGLDLGAAVEAFMHPFSGEGAITKIEYVQAGVLFVPVPGPDEFKDNINGEGLLPEPVLVQVSEPIVLPLSSDTFKDAHNGEGFNRKILLVGTGGVIIG